jgi:hypothetical protein
VRLRPDGQGAGAGDSMKEPDHGTSPHRPGCRTDAPCLCAQYPRLSRPTLHDKNERG